MKENSCCFTGHRIIKNQDKKNVFFNLQAIIKHLVTEKNITNFYCGGALGFDTMAAVSVLKIKKTYPFIKLNLILPHKRQSTGWNSDDKKLYNNIINSADNVEYISDNYFNGCMQIRNQTLVKNSNYCVFYLNKNFGGTFFTVNYAIKNNLNVINVINYNC